MDFDLAIFISSLPSLLNGALVTLSIAVLAICFGTAIGVAGGLARTARARIVSGAALLYVVVVRGVPLLVTLLFLYYGLPAANIVLSAFAVAVIALSINHGAYVTEIVRAGIQSIDRGQMRAARSLGMSYSLAMRRTVMPQALRRVLAPITNESITLLKNTSLVSVIAIGDLLRAGVDVMTWKANTFSPFVGVALIYLLMTLPLSALNGWLEKQYRVT